MRRNQSCCNNKACFCHQLININWKPAFSRTKIHIIFFTVMTIYCNPLVNIFSHQRIQFFRCRCPMAACCDNDSHVSIRNPRFLQTSYNRLYHLPVRSRTSLIIHDNQRHILLCYNVFQFFRCNWMIQCLFNQCINTFRYRSTLWINQLNRDAVLNFGFLICFSIRNLNSAHFSSPLHLQYT